MAHFFKKNKKDSQLGRGGGGGGQVDSVLAFYSDNLEFESCWINQFLLCKIQD